MKTRLGLGAVALITLAGGGVALSQVPATQSGAENGRAVYAAQCAACHGAALQGGSGPALSGESFVKKWGGHDVSELRALIASTMPYQMPKLSDVAYADVTTFLVAQSGLARATGAAALTNTQKLVSGPPVANVVPRPFEPTFAAQAEKASSAIVTDADLKNQSPNNWLTYNRTLRGDRYSPLAQITPANAPRLQVKCLFELGETGAVQTSPVIFDGVIYISGRMKTYAVDGRTCRRIWDHEYALQNVDGAISAARGVAVYDGKVIRGMPDGHLIALDAKTGKLLWDTTVHDSKAGYSITAAVVAYNGKVFLGEAGGDKGIRGRAWAFDANTGKPVWAFDLIPSGNQVGADTWDKGQEQGGGAVWSTVSIDPDRNQVIFPSGNPGPDYDGSVRKGDNLFTDSIVALNTGDGKLAWYAQQIPHDTHDFDTGAAPALYQHKGKGYAAVAQKDGYIYTYDQDTHKLAFKAQMAPRTPNLHVETNKQSPIEVCGGQGQYYGATYAPKTGLLFAGSEFRCGTIQAEHQDFRPGSGYGGGRVIMPNAGEGYVHAFDAATGALKWRFHSPMAFNGAVTPTAGGVLFAGDTGGDLYVFDQATGKIVFKFFTGGAISGGISVYGVDGQERVAVMNGNSSRGTRRGFGAATLIVFGL
jgi:PQQ-dependent dehydrogenase (methanol/ethanol family)